MASVKISALPAAGAITGTELVPVVQGGTTKQTTASAMGLGTVTTVSVATANGVSGTVANPTTTPALTLALGAITPTSVAIGGGTTLTTSGDGNSAHFLNGAGGFTTPAGSSFTGGTITSALAPFSSSTVNLMNFPLSNAPTWGSFQLSLSNLTPAGGNANDAGRTITAGITNTSTTVTVSGASYPNAISNGDVGRTISGTGIPANATIASVPATTVTSGSNNVTLPTGTINVASTTGFQSGGGKLQIKVSDGTYTVVAYTGLTGTTFTGCTSGTGTLITGSTVSSITSAVLSSAATATNASASLTVGGRSDSPFQWGFNVQGDPNYNSHDGSLVYTIEPTYTTASGSRQIEHYIGVNGENGDSGQLGVGRIFNIITSLYDENALHSVGSATMQLYPNSLVLGHPNTNNDVIIFNPAYVNTSLSKFLFQSGRQSNIDFSQYRNGENGTTTDFITRGTENILGLNSDGTVGRLFGGRLNVSMFADWDPGTVSMNLYFGLSSSGIGLRWDQTTSRFEQAITANTWVTIPSISSTDTFTNKTISKASNTLTGVAGSGANSDITSASAVTSLGTGSTNLTLNTTGQVLTGAAQFTLVDLEGFDTGAHALARTITGRSFTLVGDQSGGNSAITWGSSALIRWTNVAPGTTTDQANGANADTGITRNAAGVLEVNNGTAGTLRDLKARDIISGVVGNTFHIKSGSNAKTGTVALSSGAATVSTTAYSTTTSMVFFSMKTTSGTIGLHPYVDTGTNNVSFHVTGAATDNSTYFWAIIEQD